MYAHIGMTDLAARFYRKAGDAASEKSKNDIQMNQINGQIQMLLANLNDQGFVFCVILKSMTAWYHLPNIILTMVTCKAKKKIYMCFR